MDEWPPLTEEMPSQQIHKCRGLDRAGEWVSDFAGESDKDWSSDKREEAVQGRNELSMWCMRKTGIFPAYLLFGWASLEACHCLSWSLVPPYPYSYFRTRKPRQIFNEYRRCFSCTTCVWQRRSRQNDAAAITKPTAYKRPWNIVKRYPDTCFSILSRPFCIFCP